jgi:hypothetical protein
MFHILCNFSSVFQKGQQKPNQNGNENEKWIRSGKKRKIKRNTTDRERKKNVTTAGPFTLNCNQLERTHSFQMIWLKCFFLRP